MTIVTPNGREQGLRTPCAFPGLPVARTQRRASFPAGLLMSIPLPDAPVTEVPVPKRLPLQRRQLTDASRRQVESVSTCARENGLPSAVPCTSTMPCASVMTTFMSVSQVESSP